MNKKLFFKHILSATLLLCLFTPMVILAQDNPTPPNPENPTPTTGSVKFDIKIVNPFKGGGTTVEGFIRTVINNIFLPIGGVIAVIMIIYAGFLYVTAQGNTAKIEKAHDALLYSAIGAAILLGAWVIANAIGKTIDNLRT